VAAASYSTLSALPAPHTPMIVTAASDNHANTVTDVLLDSVLKAAGPRRVIVYDIGLRPDSAAVVAAHPAVAELRVFNFSAHPPYMRITRERTRGQYAWKAVIVGELLREYDAVLWLDAGTAPPQVPSDVPGSLASVFARVYADGVLSASSDSTVGTWTHPGTLAKLAHMKAFHGHGHGTDHVEASYPAELLDRGNCNGAIIGFARHHAMYDQVFLPWLACAREEACIAPPGSSRANHRQDQAVLSALVALAGEPLKETCIDVPGFGSLAGWRTHLDGRRKVAGVGASQASVHIAANSSMLASPATTNAA
jgi:hypothetical protein